MSDSDRPLIHVPATRPRTFPTDPRSAPSFLFLDIDGVLNSTAWWDTKRAALIALVPRPEDKLDPAAVERLNRIEEATGCHTVLTSTWRLNGHMANVRGWLVAAGYRGGLRSKTVWLHGDDRRGEEVQHWLDLNSKGQPYGLLDDEPEPNHRGRWVVTDPAVGLTDADADRMIALLGRRP